MVSPDFPPLDNQNEYFMLLVKMLSGEFDRICKKIPNLQLQDAPLNPNYVLIIEPELFHQFDQLGVKESTPDLFPILNSIFPFFTDNFNISFTFDLSSYSLYIRNLYNKIFEKMIYYYIFHKSQFSNILLQTINEFRRDFSSKKMEIEIKLPLKGIFTDIDLYKSPVNQTFIENRDFTISLKSFSNYSVEKFGTIAPWEKKKTLFSTGINTQIVKFYISAKFKLDFSITEFDEKNIKIGKSSVLEWNPVWNEIKKVIVAMSLKGTPLKYGRPFFSFPWWISQTTVQKFNFIYPEWIDTRFFFSSYKGKGLVPEIEAEFKENFDFHTYRIKHSKPIKRYLDTDFISSSFHTSFDVQDRLFNDLFNNWNNHLLDLNSIKIVFNKINSDNSYLNFQRKSFIFHRYLLLGIRNTLEDIILDTCLILEAIFLKNSSELSFRFALYVSSFLSSNEAEFENQFEFFKKLYGLRSKIIHGVQNWKDYKNKKNKLLKKFIELANLNGIEKLLERKGYLNEKNLEIIIQFFLFHKISSILKKLIDENINFPENFENLGFMKLYGNEQNIIDLFG